MFLLVSFSLAGAGSSYAESESIPPPHEKDSSIESLAKLTSELLDLNADYQETLQKGAPANPAEREAALKLLIEAAKARQAALEFNMEKHPKEVLRAVISQEKRKEFPEEVLSYLEEEVDAEGQLNHLIADDFEHGIATHSYILETGGGERYFLRFVDEKLVPGVSGGARVKIRGIKIGNQVLVAPD